MYHTGSVGTIDVTYLGAGSYTPLAFTTGGSERLRISSTGNVSIGNTNNTYKLDVSGDITGRGAFNGFAGATQNL